MKENISAIDSIQQQLLSDVATLSCYGDKLDFPSIMCFRELRGQLESMGERIEMLRKELDLCESSANCSGTSGTTTSTKDQVTSNDVPDAATPAKLSWLNCSESVPNVPGYYPTRNKNTRYYSSRGFYSNGSKWRCDDDCGSNSFDVHPDDVASHEYLPIHLV